MKFLNKILDFYIQSSLHVALAISSLVGVTANYLNLNNIKNEFLLVFFGTVVGYNFLKYFELFLKRKISIKSNKGLLGLTFFCLIASVYFFFQISIHAKLLLIGLFGLVVTYPFIRKLGWLKTVWVAFCVTELTVHLPSITNFLEWDKFVLLAFQRFFIVIALLIPFEIDDSKYDDIALQTLPHRFGITMTKNIGYGMIFLFLSLHFFDKSNLNPNLTIALIAFLAIYFTTENKKSYYTSFWVESIPIFWYILTLFFQK